MLKDINLQPILLKLSGAALANKSLQYDHEYIRELIQVWEKICLPTKQKLIIVVGGGNIWRGNFNDQKTLPDLPTTDSHQMGILATMINAVALAGCANQFALKVKVLNAFDALPVLEGYSLDKMRCALANNDVVILAGGTGRPYFSTDMLIAMLACELGIQSCLIGKNNVDGLYTGDPKNDKNAVFIGKISYQNVIMQNLTLIDQQALVMLNKTNVELKIFNINNPNNLLLICQNKLSRFSVINQHG